MAIGLAQFPPGDTALRTTPSGDPILEARFAVPALPSSVLLPARLVTRLSAGVRGPLTVVTGPPGAGKTVLVAAWADAGHAPGPVAWLTMEPDVAVPASFWTYVVETLARQVPAVRRLAESGTAQPDRAFLGRLASVLARQQRPVVLVVDQFQLGASRALGAELDFVLRHAARALRVVVVARIDPLLPLHRYRVNGQLTEIRAADLAVTPSEAGQLLRAHGLDLAPDVVAALVARTEGWVAGIRLAALAMQSMPTPADFVAYLGSRVDTVTDFLFAEVLDSQPPAVQDLMLRSSILDDLDPDLIDALTGRQDARMVLSRLEHANAFVSRRGESGSYRYHGLFAEVLRAELLVRMPGLVPELHATAARWFAARGRVADAAAHAGAAGDWPYAAEQAVSQLAVGAMVTGRQGSRLVRVFEPMPPATPGAAAATVAAAAHLTRFDTVSCQAALDRAEAQVAAAAADIRPQLLLCMAVLRVITARLRGSVAEAEAAYAAAVAAEAAVPAYLLDAHPELRALLLSSLGTAQLGAGAVDAAARTLHAALATSVEPGGELPRANVLGQLGLSEFLRGDLRAAEAYGARAVRLTETTRDAAADRVPAGYLALAAVAVARGDDDTAHDRLDQAAVTSAAAADPLLGAAAGLFRARLALARGDWARALERVAEARAAGPLPTGSPLTPLLAVAEAEAELARGSARDALAAAETLPPGSAPRLVLVARLMAAVGRYGEVLAGLSRLPQGGAVAALGMPWAAQVELLRGEARVAAGDQAGARRHLEEALALSRPGEWRRAFVEAGPWVRQEFRRRPELARRHRWLGERVVGPAAAPDEVAPLVVEPLSDRERQVLQRLAQAMSTEEIAAELYVSVNTVKTHLKSIYRKLSVSRRNKAVSRARALRLL